MSYATGSTIYEQVVSLDQNNVAVSGATFDTVLYRDGAVSATSVTVALLDATRGVFRASFVPTLYGSYQLYMRNLSTDVVFIGGPYDVASGSTGGGQTIEVYVGL